MDDGKEWRDDGWKLRFDSRLPEVNWCFDKALQVDEG